jgi:hypothetical protein
MKGALTFTDRLAFFSGLAGGAVLTYVIFAAEFSLSWILVAILGALLIVFIIGADQIFGVWYQAAMAYAPTWEHCQAMADNLKALTHEYRHDGSGGLLEPDAVEPQRRIAFRSEYVRAWLAFAKADFDRASVAGYPLDFDRDRIDSAELPDVVELAAEFERASERWREAEKGPS